MEVLQLNRCMVCLAEDNKLSEYFTKEQGAENNCANAEAEKYIHLTNEVFPDLLLQMDLTLKLCAKCSNFLRGAHFLKTNLSKNHKLFQNYMKEILSENNKKENKYCEMHVDCENRPIAVENLGSSLIKEDSFKTFLPNEMQSEDFGEESTSSVSRNQEDSNINDVPTASCTNTDPTDYYFHKSLINLEPNTSDSYDGVKEDSKEFLLKVKDEPIEIEEEIISKFSNEETSAFSTNDIKEEQTDRI